MDNLATLTPPYAIRKLPDKEFPRLQGLGPFKDMPVPPPDHTTIMVAEERSGKIIGFWCAFNAVHVEPLWVAPDTRNAGVGRQLWDGLAQTLQDLQVPNAFAIIMDTDLDTHMPMANGIGFRRIPGSVMFVNVAETMKETQEV